MAINLIFSRDSDKTRIMHSKSDNIEIMMGSETDEIVEELFELNLFPKDIRRIRRINGRKWIYFYGIDILYYNLNKISLVRGGTYIDTPKCIKNEKVTINFKNNDDKCFQYAITAALNFQQIRSYPERISNIKRFVNQYNWKVWIK